MEAGEGAEGGLEGVLHGVLRVLLIPEHPAGDGEHPREIVADQCFGRRRVAGTQPLQKRCFVRVRDDLADGVVGLHGKP